MNAAHLHYPVFLSATSAVILNPVLPTLASELTVNSESLCGLLLGGYFLSLCLGNSLLGMLSDRFGRRRVLTTALLLSAFSHLCIGLALCHHSLPTLLFGRLLGGFADGHISILRAAATDPRHTPNIRTSLASFNLAVTVGYLAGPSIVGAFAPFGIAPHIVVPWVSMLLMLVNSVVCLALFPISSKSSLTPTQSAKGSRINFPIWARALLVLLSVDAINLFLPLYLVSANGFSSEQVAQVLLILSIAVGAGNRFVLPRLPTHCSGQVIVALASLLMASGILVTLLAPSLSLQWVAAGITGVSVAIAPTQMLAIFSESLDPAALGSLTGRLMSQRMLLKGLLGIGGGMLMKISIYLPLLLGIVCLIPLVCSRSFPLLKQA